jgi:hypothetical protein
LRGEEEKLPLLLDVTSFLYDFNLLYEFARLGVDPQYADYTFNTQYSWTRKNRPLAEIDRLRLVQLRQESPILLVVIVTAAPAAATTLWVLLQSIEKISNWRINREILKLQRDKLKKEVEASDRVRGQFPSASELHFEEREATYFIDRTVERLDRSPVRITELEVNVLALISERTTREG